jgi:ribosomal-protein-alanine N-acetyltransferase
MKQILETERLILRELNIEDAQFIFQLLNSPGWIKYIGDRNVRSNEEAEQYILNGPIVSYAANGFGLYLVELKQSKQPIGLCGLLKRDYLEFVDIGFALLSQFEAMGYAFEAAAACLKYSKEKLCIDNFMAITLPNNFRSIQLLKRLGFNYEKNFIYESTNEELELYKLHL